jgi:hypothetical protein
MTTTTRINALRDNLLKSPAELSAKEFAIIKKHYLALGYSGFVPSYEDASALMSDARNLKKPAGGSFAIYHEDGISFFTKRGGVSPFDPSRKRQDTNKRWLEENAYDHGLEYNGGFGDKV